MKKPFRYSLGDVVDYIGKVGYITKVHEYTDHVPPYDFGYYDIFLFNDRKTLNVIYGIHLEPIRLTSNIKEA